MRADVWSALALGSTPQEVLATGDPVLDAELPGGGWPVGALIEILQPQGVHNEWRLLLPALVRSGHGPVVLVGAPHLPFVPALGAQGLSAQRLLRVDTAQVADRLWASEQALCCADVDAVLAWLPQARSAQLRRLQMAAAGHGKLLFVMRPQDAQMEASPAPVRLHLQPQDADSDALRLDLFKRRGPPLSAALNLPARHARMRLLLALGPRDALDCTSTPA
jgi:protein ImuA